MQMEELDCHQPVGGREADVAASGLQLNALRFNDLQSEDLQFDELEPLDLQSIDFAFPK
jgi:hypothetical protein